MIERFASLSAKKETQLYSIWTLAALVFYLVSPTLSYLAFWGLLPKFSLSLVQGALLVGAFIVRMLLFANRKIPFRSKYLALTYLLLLWISILQWIWFPEISSEIGPETFLSTIAFTFVGAWTLLLGGEFLAYSIAMQPSRLARSALLVTYLSLVFVTLHGVFKGFKLYGTFLFAFQDPVSRQVYNYLALADSLAIVGLLLMGKSDTLAFGGSLVLYIFTSICLVFSYSRASFFFFLFAGFLFLVLKFGSRQKLQLLFIFFLAGIAVLTAFIKQQNLTLIERFIAPFTESDLSMQARRELLHQGLHSLGQYWLLGHFMREVVEIGRGAYMHNWLSFWLCYGIGPFLLSIWLMFSLVIKSWLQRKKNRLALLSFCLLIFDLLEIIFARSYIWPYFWFGLGFASTVLTAPKEEQKRL